MHNGNGYGFAGGLVIGATMGAVAALLFAPRSGRELRDGFSRGSERLRERAHGLASQIRERYESGLRRTKRAAASTLDGAADTVLSLGDPSEELTAPRPLSSS